MAQVTKTFTMNLPDEYLANTAEDGLTGEWTYTCLLYTSPSPRDLSTSRMPSSA